MAGDPSEVEVVVEADSPAKTSCEQKEDVGIVLSLDPIAETWRKLYGRDSGSVLLQVGDSYTRYSF